MTLMRIIGTFLYYLTGIVVGCASLGATFYVHSVIQSRGEAPGDPFYWAITVLPGLLSVIPALLSAFALRRVARKMAWVKSWQWLLTGTVAGLAVFWLLGFAGLRLERTYFGTEFQPAKTILQFLLLGPMLITTRPLWWPVPALLATSLILWLVERAFARWAGR